MGGARKSDGWIDNQLAVMQDCCMALVIPVSKRGTVTLPPGLRKRLGLDRLENPMLLVEEQGGKLVLEAATALPVREIPESTLKKWICEDESGMDAFNSTEKDA